MKKEFINKLLAMGFILLPLASFAQEEEAAVVNQPPLFSDTMSMVMAVCVVLIGLAAVYSIFKALDLMVRVRELNIYDKHGIQEYLNERADSGGSLWKAIQKQMTDYVPIEQEKDILFDHDYDGIRELDNNLPPWWLYGFYLTIIIAVVYMSYYHFSGYGKSSIEEYEISMEQAQKEVDAYLAKQADQVDETNVSVLTDEASLAKGKEIFEGLCAACHLTHGGGSSVSVGPNLTDQYWLHGGAISDIFTTIKYGVPEKGMISWKSQIRPSDMACVASYILSLQGSNPPGAKDPQGDLYIADATAEQSELVEGQDTAVEEAQDTLTEQ